MNSPIKYKLASMLGMEILVAHYKGVVMSLGWGRNDDGRWMSIYSMDSKNEGKGECQAMIVQLKKDFPGVQWFASIPLCAAAEHIFIKHNISFSYEADAVF